MTVSTNTWIKYRHFIVNRHYLKKRFNLKFIAGIIKKIFFESKNKGQPWLTSDSLKILSNWIKSDDVVLEFGSGQSTLWFAKITNKVTSVEHDPEWFKSTQKSLKDISHNVNLILAKNKVDYLKVIKTFRDSSIDICLIDGEWRRDCLLGVFKKIKVGGTIILDNAETFLPIEWPSISFQDNWQQRGSPEKNKIVKINKELKKWRIISTSDVSQNTVLFIKKSD